MYQSEIFLNAGICPSLAYVVLGGGTQGLMRAGQAHSVQTRYQLGYIPALGLLLCHHTLPALEEAKQSSC